MKNYTKPSQAKWHKRYPQLNKVGDKLKGPCPVCGGKNRFHVRSDGLFGCRKCDDYKAIMKVAGFWKKYKKVARPSDFDRIDGKIDPPPDTSNDAVKAQRSRWIHTGTMGSKVTLVRIEKAGQKKRFNQRPPGVVLKPGEQWHPYVVNDSPDKPILIVEGPRCVDVGEKHLTDYTIATWFRSSKDTDWSFCKNRKVFIWPDNDKTGFQHRRTAAKAIAPYAKSISLITPIGDYGSGDDIVDAINRGLDLSQCLAKREKYDPASENELRSSE